MTNPLSAVLNKLDSEWRCDDLSSEEATSAFRAVAMVAVAEHDAAMKAMENWRADDTDSDWETRHRVLVAALQMVGQNVTTDADYVIRVRAAVNSAEEALIRMDGR